MLLFLVILGFLPSLIWLSYYLRKDVHPEPNRLIIRVFVYGMLIAPAAAVTEIIFIQISTGLESLFQRLLPSLLVLGEFMETGGVGYILGAYIGIGIIEEYAKYVVVKRTVLPSKDFDEPVDAMIYLIIAALGFAALENILYLTSPYLVNFVTTISSYFTYLPARPIETTSLEAALTITTFRFFGATLLHALASGIIGYFLAFSILNRRAHRPYIASGLAISALLHALYNFFIIHIGIYSHEGLGGFETLKLFGPVAVLLISMALAVAFLFRRIRNIHASLRSV